MDTQFKDIEQAFNDLKKKFQAGEISRQEFVEEMKKLRLKDGQGRFWMIGAQSGITGTVEDGQIIWGTPSRPMAFMKRQVVAVAWLTKNFVRISQALKIKE